MSASDLTVGILGAGAMGSGIAQVAASRGATVLVTDASAEALREASRRIDEWAKRKPDDTSRAEATRRITWAAGAAGAYELFRHCDLVIEAIAEDLRIKQDAFRRMEEAVRPDCLLATNTSSLSVTAIAGACRHPGRVLGIHFFNPAPLMPLVEVIPALQTATETALRGRAIVDGWGKTTVMAADTPGFIVNRIARPFYREALRIFEEGIADKATIDWAMRELGGFRMGPFELMDLIGNDVNLAVSRAVFEGFNYDPRYRPSVSQQRMVEAGWLGRKSGRGHYDYATGAPVPAPDTDSDRGQAIVDRILTMLINEAVDALFWKVASAADIELAMTKGVNYPRGLLAWGDEIGPAVVLDRMEALQREYGEDRYRTSPLLRRIVESGENLLP